MHPSDSELDRYAAGRLTPASQRAVRSHATRCLRCSGRIAQSAALLAGHRFIHETEDGPVSVELRRAASGVTAILRGTSIDVQRAFATPAGARRYALRAFSELHPEHTCGARCRAE